VAYSLAQASEARIEMFDLSGRRLAARTLDAQPGRHTVELTEARQLRPGVYLLKLTQGARTVVVRGAVVR
jgi:hypothetical protein